MADANDGRSKPQPARRSAHRRTRPADGPMRGGITRRGEFYYYVLTIPNPAWSPGSGQHKTKRKWIKGARTRKATAKLRDDARSELGKGTWTPPSTLTVAEYLRGPDPNRIGGWLGLQRTQVGESTWSNYETQVRLRIIPHLGHLRLQELRADAHLDPFLLKVYRSDGSGHAVMTLTKAVLSKALGDAYRKDLIGANPLDKATIPRSPSQLRGERDDDDEELPYRVWDRDQLAAFLAGVAGEHDAVLWATYARTGLRRGEALGLKWKDLEVDWKDPTATGGRLFVRRQLNTKKQITPPKTAASARDFALDPGLVAILRGHRRAQAAWRLRLGLGPIAPDQPVFPSLRRGGGWLRPNAISTRFKTLTRRVNTERADAGLPALPPIRLHDIRHTFATIALDAGADVRGVAVRIGHADASVTLRVYAKWLRNPDEAVAARIGAFLDAAPGAGSSGG